MRIRTVLILAVLAGLAGTAYYLLDVRGRAAREEALLVERRLVNFDPAEVREIVIEKVTERVVVRGGGERWRIVAPVDAVADGAVVEGLLSYVGRLEKVRSLGSMQDLRAVGLDRPAVTLALGLASGEILTLRLAGPNPVHTGVYAAVDGAPLVFLAPIGLAAELGKAPYVEELRDKTILPIDADHVRRVEIARHGTRIAVVRTGPRQWRVERPFGAPGDDGIIRDLLWKIGSTRAREVIRTPGPPGAYGLDRPHCRVTVVDDRGVSRTLAVVQAADDPRLLYAQVTGAPAVDVTGTDLLSDLAIDPDRLRNRQLLVYDESEVERITIRYPKDLLVLDRSADRWRVMRPVEGEAAQNIVENILEVLPNLRYGTVERTPEADLRRYGLDLPRLRVTVGLRGGRELPTLAVGREERGARFVMVGNRAPVYTVDSRLIRVIPEDPADATRYPLPEQLRRDLEKSRATGAGSPSRRAGAM